MAGVALIEATEPVDDFLRPLNDIDSRFLRVLIPLTVEEPALGSWRGTRDDDIDGDARTECL